MTTQMSDRLLVESDLVDLDGLLPYRVITGDIRANHGWGQDYTFRYKPSPPPGVMCSALWRGYISSYHLSSGGRLWLVGYDYPFSPRQSEEFEEAIEGDFWLVMKTQFRAPRLYIPFIDSMMVLDRSRWVCEKSDDS